jgi:uncharacterized protein (DUF608 family)
MTRSHSLLQKQRTYQGKNLLQIAMPLGGIGTGCICLNGYGGLQDFSIHHGPTLSALPDRHLPLDAGFALLHLPQENQTRLLEGPFPPEKIYNLGLKSQGYNGGGFEGLPRFRNCTFTGEYPFGFVKLSDPDLPVEVMLTGFNPFIPLDDRDSGLPCAILEYTLHNPTGRAVPYQFSYHLSHLPQRGAEISTRSAPLPGLGVFYWNEAPTVSPAFGSAALGILNGEPVIKARWLRGGWFDAVSTLWREVSTGSFQAAGGLDTCGALARDGGSVLAAGELAPGESTSYPVVITWHFPNMGELPPAGTPGAVSPSQVQPLAHPYYSSQWEDARQVLEYVRQHYSRLRERTQAFHDALFSSTLPPEVLDAVSANLGIIKSPTVLRYENGDLWGWEGCFCDRGCCPGSCTHVWNYAQSIPHLFPALERSLRRQEFERSMAENGHVNFRISPPSAPTGHDFHAAADGQLGGIMKVYREWQVSGDREWLARMYPLAKRSLDFCIEQWDPRRTGLVEEPHHNTYDIEFWGPEGLCSSFYLGALTAMTALARDLGCPEEASEYAELAQRGAQAMDAQLFNGEYYQQDVRVAGLRDAGQAIPAPHPQADPSVEDNRPIVERLRYQYGAGCLSDGVFGAWLARLCGLESSQNREYIRQHLASVFRYNFKPSLWEHPNPQRPGFALGDEAGLVLCSWPKGGKPTLPFVYSDEVWTGIEYQVAAHLIADGLVEEGLTLVRAARSRYDGHVRNPWNEYECGSYYARAMSSYALLIALSGFRYSAPQRTLWLAPAGPGKRFRCFFSTNSGWGSFYLHGKHLEIRLEEGELFIDTGYIRWGGSTYTLHPNRLLQSGQPYVFQLSGGNQ